MVNAQEWLNKEYPKNGKCLGGFDEENKGKKRDKIVRLSITDKKLDGELKLDGFDNLEVLECDKNKLTGLDISSCAKLKVINCAHNKLTNLDCSSNKELILLACWINEISELDVSNCPDLRKIASSSNQLTEIDLSNNTQLDGLDISDNNFSKQDLSFVKHLNNLQTLALGNSSKRKKKKGKYNRFHGNLEPLRYMHKLSWLSFNNTDVKGNIDDVKFISSKVKKIDVLSSERPNAYEFDTSALIDFAKESPLKIAGNLKNLANLILAFGEAIIDYKGIVNEVLAKNKVDELLADSSEESDKQTLREIRNQIEKEESVRKKIFASEWLGWMEENSEGNEKTNLDKIKQLEEEISQLKQDKDTKKHTQNYPVNIHEWSKQIEKNLTEKEQEVTELGIKISDKQNEIKNKEKEIKNPRLSEEEKKQLEKQINDLKFQLNELQRQLIEKDKELKKLRQENNQLVTECLNYLTLFKSFREKKEDLNELRNNLLSRANSYVKAKEKIEELLKIQKDITNLNSSYAIDRKEKVKQKLIKNTSLTSKELDNLCQIQEKFTPLETEVENLIFNEQQQESLIQRLKLQKDPIDNITNELKKKFGIKDQEKAITKLEEKVEKVIDECNERTIKTVLISSNSELQSLKNVYEQVPAQDQERIKKMIVFLDAKQTFITTRQGTIERLQKYCNKLEHYINCGWHAKIKAISQGITVIGESVNNLDFGVTQGVGIIVSVGNELFIISRNDKCIKKFNQYLTNDKNKMFWFNDHYSSLFKSVCDDYKGKISPIIIEVMKLTRDKESPFDNEYDVFKAINNIKKDMSACENKSYLTLEEMKGWIGVLKENLDEFKKELKSEEAEFYQRIGQLEKEIDTFIYVAKVMYDYEADDDDEVSIVVGETVEIVEKIDEEGWWKVKKKDGSIGLTPSTYLKEEPRQNQQQSQIQIPPK